MRYSVRLLTPLIAVVVSACAPSVHLPDPQVGLPQGYEGMGAQAPADAPQLDRWWEGFDDPQLVTLIERALSASTTARMAHARMMEARASRNQARASTFPTDKLSGNALRQDGAVGDPRAFLDESYQIAYSPSWEIDLFGRLDAIRDRADLVYSASWLDYYGTRLALTADVAEALFRARSLAVQLANAETTLRLSRELNRVGTVRQSRGLLATADLARIEADRARSEARVEGLSTELRNAKRSLLILVGDPTASTDSLLIEPALKAPPAPPELAPSLLLTRRPDVLAAETKLRAATKTVQIDRLALFPRFEFRPEAGLFSTGVGGIGSGNFFWSMAMGVTLPILDRTRLMAQLRMSEARGQQAVIGYEQAVQKAFGEAENTLASTNADRERVNRLKLAVDKSQVAYDAGRRRFQSGLIDLTTLLQIERDLTADRIALADAQTALLLHTVGAYRALGGGWAPEADLLATPAAFPTRDQN